MSYTQLFKALLLCCLLGFSIATSWAARVKDLTTVQGVRDNQLVGYGLVVGLDGTGDQTTQTPFTTQSLMSMLSQLGVNVPPGTRLQLKNVAAVMVTASLPAFSQPGQGLDVTVSSMGNAKSLSGGTLLLTPLKGADGQVYAMAQGNLVIGGAGASSGGSRTQINHLSAGRIPNGATVERDVASGFAEQNILQLELKNADFSMASAIVEAINRRFPGAARAKDARVITLNAPQSSDNKVAFLARVQEVDVAQSVAPAKIIVNARTGSVVMNQAVSIGNVAVSHGNLSVTINSTPNVSQPNALAPGQTVVTEQAEIKVEHQGGELIDLPSSANLADVVKALNRLGATPQDLISILQAMQSAGALQADLEII